MKLSYYAKKRIVDYIITTIMLIILFFTLFPIGWMIYSSLKENTDILVGKIPLSHAHNDSMLMDLDGDDLWVMTADGGINIFDKKTLKRKRHHSVQTSSTFFAIDKNDIWVASANRGLSRISKKDIGSRKDYKLPLGNYDQAKVVRTALTRNKQFIWYAMHYKGFEKVIEFNTKTQKAQRVFDLSSELYSPLQIQSLLYAGDVLWVGTDKILIKYNLIKDKIQRIYPTVSYLPMGILRINKLGDNLILAGQGGAFLFSPSRHSILEQIVNKPIESVTIKGNEVLFGTNVGFLVYDKQSRRIIEYDDLFRPVSLHKDIIKDGAFIPAAVSAAVTDGESFYLGSSYGRITQFSQTDKKVVKTTETGKGHLVISWVNYSDMWRNIDFGLYLKNSFLICGSAMFFSMIFATLAAYSVSRFEFPGVKLFSMTILATQMVPGIMFLIPIYSMFVKFTAVTGIPFRGTYYGIIFIYSAFFIPFSIWILRGFFSAIPRELEEAARIDGCSPLQVFWYIVLPLAVPGIIATGIWVFLTAWDELIFAWVMTSDATQTIPVGIRNFVGNYQNRFDLMMAAAVVSTMPVMVIFFLLQKYFVKGLTSGAVKG